MKMKIWFDMDGTIANLYGVENWLPMLIAENPMPYAVAEPLVNLSVLARLLNQLQAQGHEIGIISWLSKNSTANYDALVTEAKKGWLRKHMASVRWDAVEIVAYGTPKHEVCGSGILFDDEERNRVNWNCGNAYEPTEIFHILKEMRV